MATNFASAIDFDFSYPSEIYIDEAFTIKISIETNESYDVKAYVGDDKKEYSEIYYEGNWESPYYYLSSAIPSQTEFDLISHKKGNTEICVKLRKTGQSNFDKLCDNIEVIEQTSSSEKTQTESNDVEKLEEENEKTDNDEDFQKEIQVTETTIYSEETKPEQNPIVLTSKSREDVFSSKDEIIRNYALFSFTFLCIIIIILLSLRKL